MKRWTKTLIVWCLLLGIVFAAIAYRNGDGGRPMASITVERAIEMIDADSLLAYQFVAQELVLTTRDGDRFSVRPRFTSRLVQRLNEARVPYLPREVRSVDTGVIVIVVTAIIGVIVLVWLVRKISGGQMNKLTEIRKSKARNVNNADKAKFADIGGNREAVEMLADIVDFLRAPERWKAAQARLPRGVLMVGPPGTGKTLLARAVAGETQSTFLYTSATEFMEMFVGVGSARVRDTFEKAASQQPAVVFIDELDAIGRRRGSGFGTMHEEREQTLNQLLVALDGLERHDRTVVIAATNRLDVLDPALLRSGRFDRVLHLGPPTLEERVEILKIHTQKKPLDFSVSLESIARETEGFTGADLESLTNDAALAAVRRCRGNSDAKNDVSLMMIDFDKSLASLKRSNRQFDRLDSVLVESVSQFAEPTGRAAVRVAMTSGVILEGDIVWMNAAHIKLRLTDGSEVVVAKDLAEQMSRLEGTDLAPEGDFSPDRWAGRDLEVG